MHPILSAHLANAVSAERRRQAAARRASLRGLRSSGHERAPVQPGMSRLLTSLRRLAATPRS
jgi:hypothetical protein